MNKRVISSIYRIGIQRLIRKGIRVTIIPSYVCNYSCSYCGRKMGGSDPKAGLRSLEEWKRYLTDLDGTFKLSRSRLREIVLTGGEPTLLPYFNELCDFITERWLLTVYTNLSDISRLSKLDQTPHLIVHATFHPEFANSILFNKNWRLLDKIHRVVVDEIGQRRLEDPYKKTRLKPFATMEDMETKLAMLRVDPNFAAYLYCIDDTAANTKK